MASQAPPSPRRPLPQPVEESQRSHCSSTGSTVSTASRDRDTRPPPGHPTSPTKPRRALPLPLPRPLPLPLDTASTSAAQHLARGETSDTSRDLIGVTSTAAARSGPQPMASPAASSAQPTTRRKFAPQMIETSRRSRRNTRSDSDTTPLASPAPTPPTAPSPELSKVLPLHMRPDPGVLPPNNSPIVPPDLVPQAPESKFSSAKLAEKAPRRHSFRVPDLPVIPAIPESNDSEPSSPDSDLTREQSRRKGATKRASQARESQDETTSGYLLSLAAEAAETQLREQVMAAYPNENLHEPVDHYAVARDPEDDSEAGTGRGQPSRGEADPTQDHEPAALPHQRRDSEAGEGGWGMAEMRRHRDKLEQERRVRWEQSESSKPLPILSNIGASDPNAEFRKRAADGPGGKPAVATGVPPKTWQTHNELKSMAKAASPPMAGQNLRFPRCESPSNTRLDVHQYPGQRKPTESEARQHTGLWTPKGSNTRQDSQSGLWMGVNAATAQEALAPPRFLDIGLMTPGVEREDPFVNLAGSVARSRKSSYVPASSLPPSPPSSQEEGGKPLNTQHKMATVEWSMRLEDELDDNFVTQVYNYLSLGYPSLARPYDEELAKIAQMDIAVLRKDDGSGNSKGYVGAPEGTGPDVRGCSEGACERWMALKKYVKEWGRQQSMMPGAGGLRREMGDTPNDQGGWGARARKGSWAI